MTKKIKKWDKRVELARRRCASVIDFDSEPVIEYTAVKCSIALSQIDELDKLHKAELKANNKEWERRIEGMMKTSEQDNIGKLIGIEIYNQALSDLLE